MYNLRTFFAIILQTDAYRTVTLFVVRILVRSVPNHLASGSGAVSTVYVQPSVIITDFPFFLCLNIDIASSVYTGNCNFTRFNYQFLRRFRNCFLSNRYSNRLYSWRQELVFYNYLCRIINRIDVFGEYYVHI